MDDRKMTVEVDLGDGDTRIMSADEALKLVRSRAGEPVRLRYLPDEK